MSQFVIDRTLSTALSQLREPTRITDPDGRVLGVFTPSTPAKGPLFSEADLEEAERISRDERDKGRPLQEIWADIRAGRPVE